MNLIERFLELASIQDDSLLDVAIMTEKGLESWRSPVAHSCSNGQSTTKLFTAVCIALLADAGKLSFEDKLTQLLPDVLPDGMDPRWHDVTVHHALTHTTGIDHGIDIEGDELPQGGKVDYATLTFQLPLAYAPGEHYQYSDVAYYLLSRAVEKASGVTMEAFIRRELGPVLGLRDFAIACCPQGHSFGGGCMYMRGSDMVKLGYMLSCGGVYNGVRVLREETVRAMMERGYALHHPEGSDIYLKTGAYGQIIVFSAARPFAAAWHRNAYDVKPVPDRNDTLLAVLRQVEQACFGC